jgi:serine/threonine-protein kinase
VKVVDFGLAKAPTSLVTHVGEVLGTPYYMSPEQVHGSASVDARSDLWSLAVIVYRCLTGQLPFEAPTLVDLLIAITSGPIPVPSAIAPDLPCRFDQWWAHAVQRDPNERFQTAKELDTALAIAFELSPPSGIALDKTIVGY